MADKKGSDSRHEEARDLAEAALGKLVDGDETAADTLIEKARRLDPSAPDEVVADLDEDAAKTGRQG